MSYKIDNLQYCKWSRKVFEINREARLDAVHVTIVYHEDFKELQIVLKEWEKHFHKIATEITFIIKGKIKINDTIFSSGDIFVIEPNEIADPTFLEDSEVIVVKLPSNASDKYNIER